jgi:hypothetical protein
MKRISQIIILFSICFSIYAQPKPGEIFKEYSFYVSKGVTGREDFLRVCGDGYYEDQVVKGVNPFNEGFVKDGWFTLPQNLDLKDATKAEVLVEKMLCHDGITGLAIKFNEGGEWHRFPDAANIPHPQEEYTHHFYPIVSLPLTELKSGDNANKFRFTVGNKQRWGMPQNILYGMVVRVYYKPTKPHVDAVISTIKSGDLLGEKVALNVKANAPFNKVEYLHNGEDLNLEGDGNYEQWHYRYHRGELKDNLGSSITGNLEWNTEWTPDQSKPMQIAARVTAPDGTIYMTQTIDNLMFKRNFKVELCKPYDIPRRWATRERAFDEAFDLKGKASKAEKFKIVATTWSPGYMNGIYLNDFLLMDRESCRYCFHTINKVIESPEFLAQMNVITTGKTPLYNGKMTHGTEIQYPGIMVLVKYKTD